MTKIYSISDPQYIANQYRTALNLNTRIRFHKEFSTNAYGWHPWVFDQLKLKKNSCILELGCGVGSLWLENIERIPPELIITLSDFSPGILQQAKQNLQKELPHFQFNIIDAQSIPFDDNSFDIIIANHLLFHVQDKIKTLKEINRVLKPNGFLYASTIGMNHLKELTNLITGFDAGFAPWGIKPADSFFLENGAFQLGVHFNNISLNRYLDSLLVTDARKLKDYILSSRLIISAKQKLDLVKYVEQEFIKSNNKFHITKDTGIFVANNI